MSLIESDKTLSTEELIEKLQERIDKENAPLCDEDTEVILKWIGLCRHKWVSEDYVVGTFLNSVTYCSECSISFDKKTDYIFDGNFKDECRKKLKTEASIHGIKWDRFIYDTVFKGNNDDDSLLIAIKLLDDNKFFFSSLAKYLREGK